MHHFWDLQPGSGRGRLNALFCDGDNGINEQIEILAPAAVIGDRDPNRELTVDPCGGRGGDPALLKISHNVPVQPIQCGSSSSAAR